MLVRPRVTHSIKLASIHFYTCVERGTVKVKCLALPKTTTQCFRAGFKSVPLNLESSILTIRPLRLSQFGAVHIAMCFFTPISYANIMQTLPTNYFCVFLSAERAFLLNNPSIRLHESTLLPANILACSLQTALCCSLKIDPFIFFRTSYRALLPS